MPQVPECVLGLGNLGGKEVTLPLRPMLHGMTVILTDGGVWCPVRSHSKRANQGKRSYHDRVQKKWTKRFGKHWVEIQARGECFKVGRDSIIVRREDWAELSRLERG